MASTKPFDLVVIGAGWFGLAAARMYIELHRDHDVLVLDAASTIGGVWATDRLYPGLKTNNMLGTFEYPDFPMGEATYDVKPGQHIPAATVHQYLLDYATKFGVLERVRFNTKVEIVEPAEGGTWRLTTFSSVQHAPKPISVLTKRLIVATGLTSEPSMPEILGMQDFIPPLFHSKDFRQNAETLKTAERVVVLGGAKSAWDVAYEYASAGVSVEMVIRESGHGPVWMSPPYVTPLKKWLEKLVHTRFLTFLSPCIWGDEDGYEATRNFLHGTTIGRKLVDIFWTVLTEDVVSLNRYDSHPETKKLKPWAGAFWVGTGLSILNYPTDFFDYVRSGKIHVHIADIDRLLPHSLRFKSSVHNSGSFNDTKEDLETDALILATGWKQLPSITFLGISDETLGLPFNRMKDEVDGQKRLADVEIFARFPRLKAQPTLFQPELKLSEPFRHYRFMVPPEMIADRNIAFAGFMSSISNPINAHIQGLWISAYFDNSLHRLPSSIGDIQWETMLHTRFLKWRYPLGYGAKLPDFVFDGVPYLDMLLGDLGLQKYRKSSPIWELFSPYGPEDYKDLVTEWKSKQRHLEKGSLSG